MYIYIHIYIYIYVAEAVAAAVAGAARFSGLFFKATYAMDHMRLKRQGVSSRLIVSI